MAICLFVRVDVTARTGAVPEVKSQPAYSTNACRSPNFLLALHSLARFILIKNANLSIRGFYGERGLMLFSIKKPSRGERPLGNQPTRPSLFIICHFIYFGKLYVVYRGISRSVQIHLTLTTGPERAR